MLDRGFVDNIKEILQSIPGDVQISLFSATFPQPILDLTSQFMREGCAKILVKKEQLTLEGRRGVVLICRYQTVLLGDREGGVQVLDAGGVVQEPDSGAVDRVLQLEEDCGHAERPVQERGIHSEQDPQPDGAEGERTSTRLPSLLVRS